MASCDSHVIPSLRQLGIGRMILKRLIRDERQGGMEEVKRKTATPMMLKNLSTGMLMFMQGYEVYVFIYIQAMVDESKDENK
uniref:Uncharacterized protein n=1 Tax=Kalanchoe fedtschenkoi TaxID=63787 RepID=A0A7N0RAV5_KALFE